MPSSTGSQLSSDQGAVSLSAYFDLWSWANLSSPHTKLPVSFAKQSPAQPEKKTNFCVIHAGLLVFDSDGHVTVCLARLQARLGGGVQQ